MDKMKVFVCYFLAFIIISIGYLPVVGMNSNEDQKNIVVETYVNDGKNYKKILTELDYNEAEELKQILIDLDNAIKRDDQKEILKYESLLNEKGILDKKYKNLFSGKIIENLYLKIKNSKILQKFNNKFTSLYMTNISNSNCFVNIAGSGFMLYTIGMLLAFPTLFLVSIFGEAILAVLLPIYVLIMLITHLIPFRILLPMATINVEEGSIATSGGSSGSQEIIVESPKQVNLGGFTGITINIPTEESNGFLFVSGFTLSIDVV